MWASSRGPGGHESTGRGGDAGAAVCFAAFLILCFYTIPYLTLFLILYTLKLSLGGRCRCTVWKEFGYRQDRLINLGLGLLLSRMSLGLLAVSGIFSWDIPFNSTRNVLVKIYTFTNPFIAISLSSPPFHTIPLSSPLQLSLSLYLIDTRIRNPDCKL